MICLYRFFPQEYIGDTVVVCSSLLLKITWLGESRLHIATVFTGGAPWISKEILRKLPYGAREFRDAELMITMDGEWLHMLGVSQPYPCLQPLPMYGQGNLEEMVCWMYMDWIGDIGNTKVHFSQMMRGTIVWMCLKSHSQKGGSFLHLSHQASKNRNVS